MAQAFWDENKQREWTETDTGIQGLQMGGMKEVLDLLTKYNINFKVEGDRIMIKGDVNRVLIGHSLEKPVQEIVITQGNNRIWFSFLKDFNRIGLWTEGAIRNVFLPKRVWAKYDYPYLIIYF